MPRELCRAEITADNSTVNPPCACSGRKDPRRVCSTTRVRANRVVACTGSGRIRDSRKSGGRRNNHNRTRRRPKYRSTPRTLPLLKRSLPRQGNPRKSYLQPNAQRRKRDKPKRRRIGEKRRIGGRGRSFKERSSRKSSERGSCGTRQLERPVGRSGSQRKGRGKRHPRLGGLRRPLQQRSQDGTQKKLTPSVMRIQLMR